MLVTMKEQLLAAEDGGYAVGMFNSMTVEMFQALIAAAEEMHSPVIVGTSENMAEYIGLENIGAMTKIAAIKTDIPISLHLDHGTNLEVIKEAINAGYTSVMIDGSKHPFEKNLEITRQGAALATSEEVTVEGELGHIVETEDEISSLEREALMTVPEEAGRFVEESGIDCLAINIGNAHGLYKGDPQLDFDRLKSIKSQIDIPVVLHGASGIPDEDIRKAISLGIRKINIATDLQVAFMSKVREILEADSKVYDPRKILGPAKENIKAVAKEKMDLFQSAGKA